MLNKGELGIEKTAKGEHKIKVGDGTSAWSALPYSGSTPTEMAGKADKVSGATAEHLAALDTNGNLKDSGESVVSLKEYVAKAITDLPNIRHYGARWNKTQAQMTRLYDAASFPTAITNFAHRGSVNANYSNPFDSIYPWAGIKLCNISIDLYRNLAAGDSITKCVTAWEGDVDFSYNDANGVWRYRPEFWGKSWEDDTYRYRLVCSLPRSNRRTVARQKGK